MLTKGKPLQISHWRDNQLQEKKKSVSKKKKRLQKKSSSFDKTSKFKV